MKHFIVVKSGTWAGREVIFQGAVFVTPGESNLYASDIFAVEPVEDEQAEQEGHHLMRITAHNWEMVAEVTPRAFQSISSHRTVNVVRKQGRTPSNMDLNQQLAFYEQQDAAKRRTCCGG